MNNLLILPIAIPLGIGALLIFFAKHQRIQRVISAITALSLLVISIGLARAVHEHGIIVMEVGAWPAPFGIVFVADSFAVFMVMLSSLIGAVCLFFAFKTLSPERGKHFFYSFYFFLLTGINGAFLTGDIFNLFVFFEVMLLSSYILIVFGGTKYQLRESFKYVMINALSSILFLVAVAYIYSITGTVNMAHLAVRAAELGQQGALQVTAILFLIVFSIKGALFPLYFWLPNSYYGPPTAVAALFGGLLTKVGIYAIIRTFTLIFVQDIDFTHNLLLILAGFTMFFGVLGAVSQFDFKRILSYHIISQVGYMVMGLGLYTKMALAGAVYYIAHHIIVKTALFLFSGTTQAITGTTDLRKMGGVLKTHPLLTWMFMISAFSLAGIQPLSGFFSKFPLILDSITGGRYIIAAVALVVGLLTLFSMFKIVMYVFWGEQKHSEEQANINVNGMLAPIAVLVLLTIVLGFAADPIFEYASHIADELMAPDTYIQAVLGRE